MRSKENLEGTKRAGHRARWRAAGTPSLAVKQEEKKMFLESRVRAVNYKQSNNSYQVQSYDKAPNILYRIRKHSKVSSTDFRSRMKIQL